MRRFIFTSYQEDDKTNRAQRLQNHGIDRYSLCLREDDYDKNSFYITANSNPNMPREVIPFLKIFGVKAEETKPLHIRLTNEDIMILFLHGMTTWR